MKKMVIFFTIVVIIIFFIFYMYLGYKNNHIKIQEENKLYESYYNEETNGNNLASVINKAIDNNNRNNISKDNKGKYIENDENSINIDIKFTDNDEIYNMEKIANGDIANFVEYYSKIKFKCTKLEYHNKTGKIKYMLFEQITQ